MNSRKLPKFKKQHMVKKRLEKTGWRKPRGIDSEQRKNKKSRGAHPKIGYASPRKTRYLHPNGLKEVYVKNISDLLSIDPKKEAARISGSLGKKKRNEIIMKADELKITILNR